VEVVRVSSTTATGGPDQHPELLEKFLAFYRRHAQAALAQLAEGYPHDTTSITVDWQALARFDRTLAEDVIDTPSIVRPIAEDAVARYDYPIDVDIDAGRIDVRLSNLPDGVQHDVGHYSPTDVAETLRSVRGQVSQMTQPDSLMTEAASECQRCGTTTPVPQTPDSWQEPRECKGCEREGPFQIDFGNSTMVDHQVVRLQTPPEDVTDGGTDTLDVEVRGDVVGSVSPGERVLATAEMDLRQTGTSREKQPTFEPYGEADSFEHLERDLDDVAIEQHR
jgi:replicative DNA helicase Mcm